MANNPKIQEQTDICADAFINETEMEKSIRICREALLKCLKEDIECAIPTCDDGAFSIGYESSLLKNECECNGEILTFLNDIEVNKTNILRAKDNQESSKLLLCYAENTAESYDEINECLMASLNQDVIEMEKAVKELKDMDIELDKQVMLVAESIKKAKGKVDLTYKAICEFEICYKSICQSKDENNIAVKVEPKFKDIKKTFNKLCRETDESLVTAVKIVGLNSLNSVEKLEGRISAVKSKSDLLKKDVEENAKNIKAEEIKLQEAYNLSTAEVRKNRYALTNSLGKKRGTVSAFCYLNGELLASIKTAVKDDEDFALTNSALDTAFDNAKG